MSGEISFRYYHHNIHPCWPLPDVLQIVLAGLQLGDYWNTIKFRTVEYQLWLSLTIKLISLISKVSASVLASVNRTERRWLSSDYCEKTNLPLHRSPLHCITQCAGAGGDTVSSNQATYPDTVEFWIQWMVVISGVRACCVSPPPLWCPG